VALISAYLIVYLVIFIPLALSPETITFSSKAVILSPANIIVLSTSPKPDPEPDPEPDPNELF